MDIKKEREDFEQHLSDTGLVEFAGYGFLVDECDVAELPDRTSPEYLPEALVLTGDELEEILIQKLADSFEHIQKAAQEIWYDNGMINQFEPLGIKLDYLNRWLVQQPEAELMKLSLI